MKKLILLTSICVLTGCLHEAIDEPKKINAEIEYPPLTSQPAFDELQTGVVDKVIDRDNAEETFSNAIIRMMNVLELANQEIGQVAANTPVNAVFKPQARSLRPVWAYSENCKNEEGQQGLNTEALVWDDANEDNLPLDGDKWYYILEECRNNANSSTYVSGVILYSGMDDPFNERKLQVFDEVFSNYQYLLDIQIDFSDSLHAIYNNASFVISREEGSSGEEITDLVVNDGSKMGVESSNGLYLLDVNAISAKANDDLQTLRFNIDADYFEKLEQEDANERFSLFTTEDLVFSFDFDTYLLDKLTNIKLESGSLKLSSESGSAILSVIDEDTLSIEVDEDNDGFTDASLEIDQTDFFENPKFKLLNIMGG